MRRIYELLGVDEVEKYCKEKLQAEPHSLPANFTMFNVMILKKEFNKLSETYCNKYATQKELVVFEQDLKKLLKKFIDFFLNYSTFGFFVADNKVGCKCNTNKKKNQGNFIHHASLQCQFNFKHGFNPHARTTRSRNHAARHRAAHALPAGFAVLE